MQLSDFMVVTEVDRASPLIGDLFHRKFAHDAPDFPHHFVALIKAPDGALRVAGYSHMLDHGQVMLSGGSCSDGRVIAQLTEQQCELLTAAGGVYRQILRHAFTKYEGKFIAFFGYSGNERAIDVAKSAGFEATANTRLFVRWNRDVSADSREQLFREVEALGAF